MTRLTAFAAAIAATLAPGSIVAVDEFGGGPSPAAAQRPIGDPDDDEGGLEEDDDADEEDDDADEDDEEPMQLRGSPI